jgi:hypothetical protein
MVQASNDIEYGTTLTGRSFGLRQPCNCYYGGCTLLHDKLRLLCQFSPGKVPPSYGIESLVLGVLMIRGGGPNNTACDTITSPSRHHHWLRYKHSAMREFFAWVVAQWRLDCSGPLRTWIVLA